MSQLPSSTQSSAEMNNLTSSAVSSSSALQANAVAEQDSIPMDQPQSSSEQRESNSASLAPQEADTDEADDDGQVGFTFAGEDLRIVYYNNQSHCVCNEAPSNTRTQDIETARPRQRRMTFRHATSYTPRALRRSIQQRRSEVFNLIRPANAQYLAIVNIGSQNRRETTSDLENYPSSESNSEQ